MRLQRLTLFGAAAILTTTLQTAALAVIPYTPVSLPPGATPSIGPGLITPDLVFGKEYSHDIDEEIGGVADPQQVIAWDGIGGTANGVDFSGTRPNYQNEDQVDAIAHHRDGLFRQLREDRAHLVFSHDDMISVYPGGPAAGGGFTPGALVPSAGPITTSGGAVIGGAGELSYELAGAFSPPSTQGLWAEQKVINGMPLPVDVDGVELWGPEPAFDADADKYSLQIDGFSGTAAGPGVSVWNGSGTPYISQATIVAAVTSLLGPLSGSEVLPFPTFIDGQDVINVDALMVSDSVGEIDSFDRDPTGAPGDQIIFSVQQILDPTDADGYYATGSELFVLDATLGVSYLEHGGHLWDHTYALSNFVLPATLVDGYGVMDINAIEAVGEVVVPEPAAALLMATCFGSAMFMRRRLG